MNKEDKAYRNQMLMKKPIECGCITCVNNLCSSCYLKKCEFFEYTLGQEY